MTPEHQGMTLEDAQEALKLAQRNEKTVREGIELFYGSVEDAQFREKFYGTAVDAMRELRKATRIRSEFEEMVKRKTREAAIGEQRCD